MKCLASRLQLPAHRITFEMIQNSPDTLNPTTRRYIIAHAKTSMEKNNSDQKGCITAGIPFPSLAHISEIAMAYESNSNDARVNS